MAKDHIRGHNWSFEEDVAVGTNQNKKVLWAKIVDKFNENSKTAEGKLVASVYNRWKTINKACTLWKGSLERAVVDMASGRSAIEVVSFFVDILFFMYIILFCNSVFMYFLHRVTKHWRFTRQELCQKIKLLSCIMFGTSSRIVWGGEPMRTNNGQKYLVMKSQAQMIQWMRWFVDLNFFFCKARGKR